MLLAFVDESYTEDYYFLAAAIGDELQWEQFRDELEKVRLRTAEKHKLPDGFEFHAYEMMSGSGDWKSFRGRHREAAGVYRAVLLAANRSKIRFIFRGLHLPSIAERRGKVEDPHGEALMHLLERIERFAIKRKATEQVRVVADEIASQAELQNQFRGYKQLGTWGYRSRKLEMIGTPIMFLSSRNEPGLQLVDFAVYLQRRRESKIDTHPAAVRTIADLAKQLDRLTDHHSIWPPQTKAPR